MADLTWTTTDTGYYARGATTNYNINRTPGHRFWLCLDGTRVKSGKLAELKDAAQRNENADGGADGGTDDSPKSEAGRPKPTGNGRTKPKPLTPTATNPDTAVVPAAAINREYVEAVDATTPDAYPPRGETGMVGLNVTDAPAKLVSVTPRVIETDQGPVVHIPGPVAPGDVQLIMQAAAQIRKTWAAEGTTREGIVREFGELLGVTAPPVSAPAPAADDDGDDSDVDTPLVPNVPDVPHHNHGNPVGAGFTDPVNVGGVQPAYPPQQPRRSATAFPCPLVNAFRAAMRPVAKIVAGMGGPSGRGWAA